MSFYERQFGHLSGEQQKEPPEGGQGRDESCPELTYRQRLLQNLGRMAVWNLLVILCLIPAGVFYILYFLLGGLVFLVPALILTVPAGPAVVCLYTLNFRIVRGAPGYECRSFWGVYASNVSQGCLAMVVTGIPLLCLSVCAGSAAEIPLYLWALLLLGYIVTAAFMTFCFAQISLFPLPMGSILKNSVILILACGWRGLMAALLPLFYAGAVLLYPTAVSFSVPLLGPALINCLCCRLIWPKLQGLILADGTPSNP